jgi:putative transposase
MERVWADRGYSGKIGAWMKERLGWTLEIVKPPRRWVKRVPADEEPPPWAGFTVLPRRWVIEGTIAWILFNRRMSRDYEFLAQMTEALVYVAMIRLICQPIGGASKYIHHGSSYPWRL